MDYYFCPESFSAVVCLVLLFPSLPLDYRRLSVAAGRTWAVVSDPSSNPKSTINYIN
jgi:hypothetical protein